MAPQTPLAAVQSAWPQAVGAKVAARAQAVAERDGVVTVSCESAVWAQELDLIHDDVMKRLRSALAELDATPFELRGLRFTADLPRHGQ